MQSERRHFSRCRAQQPHRKRDTQRTIRISDGATISQKALSSLSLAKIHTSSHSGDPCVLYTACSVLYFESTTRCEYLYLSRDFLQRFLGAFMCVDRNSGNNNIWWYRTIIWYDTLWEPPLKRDALLRTRRAVVMISSIASLSRGEVCYFSHDILYFIPSNNILLCCGCMCADYVIVFYPINIFDLFSNPRVQIL